MQLPHRSIELSDFADKHRQNKAYTDIIISSRTD